MKAKVSRSNPGNIFVLACEFVAVSRFAESHRPVMLFPVMTNWCFALELLFKTIIALENNDQFPNDHSLFRLFQKLDQTTKDEVEALWSDRIATPYMRKMAHFYKMDQGRDIDLRLSKCLKESEDGFTRFRYAFEAGKDPPPFFLSGLDTILMNLIIGRRPEFAGAYQRTVG